MPRDTHRVAIVFPADPAQGLETSLDESRFAPTAAALRAEGLEVVGAPYRDEDAAAVREILMGAHGALVWVNPITDGRDRSVLNTMLSEVSAAGVLVSAHPEVIGKMGTKMVLHHTRHMSWGADVRHYPAFGDLEAGIGASLATGPRVLKQVLGHSGGGVWKVSLAALDDPAGGLLVRHAQRGGVEEGMTLDAFLDMCRPFFDTPGGLIDQAYQDRLTDGAVRCYLVGDTVQGFGEQLINALYPAEPGAPADTAPQPGQRLYYPPTREDFQPLKTRLEDIWLAELCQATGVDRSDLPLLWDVDFLYGPKDDAGADTYVLCEINMSSIYPYPESAIAPLAAAARTRLESRG